MSSGEPKGLQSWQSDLKYTSLLQRPVKCSVSLYLKMQSLLLAAGEAQLMMQRTTNSPVLLARTLFLPVASAACMH
jgi:hypothetical protein